MAFSFLKISFIFIWEIRAWNLTSRHLAWRAKAHQGFVRGLSVNQAGTHVLSCGDDKAIRIWSLNSNMRSESVAGYGEGEVTPELSILSKYGLMDLSCTWDPDIDVFATCGAQIDLWSTKRYFLFKTHSFVARSAAFWKLLSRRRRLRSARRRFSKIVWPQKAA